MNPYDELIINNEKLIYYVLQKLNLYNMRDEYYDLGLIGLCKAAKKFDPNRGVKFSTLACMCIQNSILHEIRRNKKKIDNNTVSLNTIIGGDKNNLYLEDILSNYELEIDIIDKEEIQDLYKAIDRLENIEKRIIKLYYFENMSQKEISNILKMSQPNVSKKITKIVIKLKNILKEANKHGWNDD